jgi:hypothetical protein
LAHPQVQIVQKMPGYGIVCYKADRAVRALAVRPSLGADVRGGSLAP